MGGTSPWYHLGSKSRYGLDMVVSSFLKMGSSSCGRSAGSLYVGWNGKEFPFVPFCERNTHSQVYFSSAASGAQSSVAITAQPVPKGSGMRTSPQYTGTVCVYAFSTAMASNRRSLGNSPAVRTGNTGAPPPAFLPWCTNFAWGRCIPFRQIAPFWGQRFPQSQTSPRRFPLRCVSGSRWGRRCKSNCPLHVSASSITNVSREPACSPAPKGPPPSAPSPAA